MVRTTWIFLGVRFNNNNLRHYQLNWFGSYKFGVKQGLW